MVGYALKDLTDKGKVIAGSSVDLVTSAIGVAVKAGTPKPDIGSADALKRAQMSVANCKGWGQSKSRYPRAGRGGKPGVGVGTWADENAGWFDFPEQNEMVDNSNVQRPDTDARGHTDRGEGELADNLAPTKVKGQFTPGGQMPSISLKGVSIKGQSKVAYEEAVATAQLEAQSALSQDKVPRAYQGAVRDYFDDTKK
jgi:hypothetical protein